MNWFNESIFLGFLSLSLLVVLVLLTWLINERFRLHKELKVLNEYISRNNRDIAGLCSAALKIDERLIAHEELLTALQNKAHDYHSTASGSQSYHNAIQRAQSGADVQDLMQTCGLSRDEASLLIHLHGKSN